MLESYIKYFEKNNPKKEGKEIEYYATLLTDLFFITLFNTYYLKLTENKKYYLLDKNKIQNEEYVKFLSSLYSDIYKEILNKFEENKKSNEFNENNWKSIIYKFKEKIDYLISLNTNILILPANKLIAEALYLKQFNTFYSKLTKYEFRDVNEFINYIFNILIYNYLNALFLKNNYENYTDELYYGILLMIKLNLNL